VRTDLSEVIAENFGANATYVEGLLSRFRSNPELVDESWRAYFAELLGEPVAGSQAQENGAGTATAPAITEATQPLPTASPAGISAAVATEPKTAAAPSVNPTGEAVPIRGGALKIVENMEASLGVPTATSVRVIPAKLLEVNRQILNNHLKRARGGKVSFTHLIGFAVLLAGVFLFAAAWHDVLRCAVSPRITRTSCLASWLPELT